MIWENSQFADFMSSLFCCNGSGDVNKTNPKIKYVVSLCCFFIHALQPKLCSIKHEGVKPWKMGGSLLNWCKHKIMKQVMWMGLLLGVFYFVSILLNDDFFFRCFPFRVTSQLGKRFCPTCGNSTLLKVSVSVDENGATHYSVPNSKKPFNIRGKKVQSK